MLGKIGTSLKNAGKSAVSNVGGQLKEISSKLTDITGGGEKVAADKNTQDLIFPIEMAGQPRPCICFTCFAKVDNKPMQLHSWFPIPSNINFSDTANYTELSLGAIGGALAGDIQSAYTQGGNAMDGILNRMKSFRADEAAVIARSINPYADQIRLASRSVKNPNTNTTFNGHDIRAFSFSFKMIAKSRKESELIRQLSERFRHYSYAELVNEATGFMLAFPPVWTIRFMTPDENGSFVETKSIPRIFSCYLKSVETSINADSVTFYNDGAPTTVDITLSFQETRALTRKDITEMENDKLENRGIDPDTGRPLLSTVIEEDVPQVQ